MTKMESVAAGAAPARVAATGSAARVALWLTHGVVVASILMQVAKGDWFPPADSMSQYGVGPSGWTFTLFLVLCGLASLALAALGWARPGWVARSAAALLVVAGVPMIVAGFVPADATASAATASGTTHLVLSTAALVALPVAGFVSTFDGGAAAPALRWTLRLVSAVSITSLILLLFAAGGVDVTGLGQRAGWALFQTIAVVLDGAILYLVRLQLVASDLPRESGARPLAPGRR